MRRKAVLFLAAAVMTIMITACAKDNKTNTSTENEATPTITVLPSGVAKPTETVTPTEAVTPTETVTPTMTLMEKLARNRELHESIAPKTTVNPYGTAPDNPELQKLKRGYGIWDLGGKITVESHDLPVGEAADTISVRYPQIDGLKDTAVQNKINERLKKAAETMADPVYYPNARGFMNLLTENEKAGWLPSKEVDWELKHTADGILSLSVFMDWKWVEVKPFDFPLDELCEYVRNGGRMGEFAPVYVWYEFSNPTFPGLGDVRIIYSAGDSVWLNFNLATGEELSLSDLFPKGMDYIKMLNDKMEEQSSYLFEFYDDLYQETGEIQGAWGNYDPSKEYDEGALNYRVTGDESFYLSGNYLNVGAFAFRFSPENQDGGDAIYRDGRDYSRERIGSVWFGKGNGDADPFGNSSLLGSCKARLNGEAEITADVYCGGESLADDIAYAREEGIDFLTESTVLDLAGQSLETWKGARHPDQGCALLLTGVWKYPNGFYRLNWTVKSNVDGEWKSCYEDSDQYSWMKDGKIIPEEELFDASLEDVLTDVFDGMTCRIAEESHEVFVDREQAAAAAKALAPYIVGFPGLHSSEYGIFRWKWEDYLFQWESGGTRVGLPYFYMGEKAPEELQGRIPDEMWKQLSGERHFTGDDGFVTADPYALWKHLRMYEGLSFE